jgi:hypothetical protein
MSRSTAIAAFLLLLWLALCYWLRFAVMEDIRWVEECTVDTALWICELRSLLGLTIHFGVLAWAAIVLAVPAWFIKGNAGRALAWASLFSAIPALVLYTVTLAAFALLVSALRLIRK